MDIIILFRHIPLLFDMTNPFKSNPEMARDLLALGISGIGGLSLE